VIKKNKIIINFLIVLFIILVFGNSAYAFGTYEKFTKLPQPPATSKGELIYQESNCAMCHGELGDGEGFLAVGLDPKPRDFTSFIEMSRIPDSQIISAINSGVSGTAMPAHPDFDDAQMDELIIYIRSLLAETHITVNLCVNAAQVIDVGRDGLDLSEFEIEVDNPDVVEVTRKGSKVRIAPANNRSFLKKLMKKKVSRTHVKLMEKDNTLSLIAVRLHGCIK
jgi:mono/diheme cytochrome c family protein/virulence-associated protein VagC